MSKRDFYTVLELTPSCTSQDVRQNYRRLALRWHPDKCADKTEAELRFNEIHEAYTVLTDENKKRIYDNYGHKGLEINEEGGENGSSGKQNLFFQKGFRGTEKSAFDILKDIFQEKDDDYFFQKYESFEIPQNVQSTMKTFMEESVFTKENDSSNDFFENYKPTFLNPNFFMAPPVFPTSDLEEKPTTQFFSFLSTNISDQTFSATSTTFIKRINTMPSMENLSLSDNLNQSSTDCSDNRSYDPLYTPKPKEQSFIFLDDEMGDDIFGKNDEVKFFVGCSEGTLKSMGPMKSETKINSPSRKIQKPKESLNIRLINKKPSKKSKS